MKKKEKLKKTNELSLNSSEPIFPGSGNTQNHLIGYPTEMIFYQTWGTNFFGDDPFSYIVTDRDPVSHGPKISKEFHG